MAITISSQISIDPTVLRDMSSKVSAGVKRGPPPFGVNKRTSVSGLNKSNMHRDDTFEAGLEGIHGVDKRLSISIKTVNPPDQGSVGNDVKVVEDQFASYCKNIVTAGAIYTAGLRQNGPLSKRAIDNRGTKGQEDVIAVMMAKNRQTRLVTITGEGEKDDSIHIPTGRVYSNVAEDYRLNHKIEWNTDPVDGTNNTSSYNLGPGQKKDFVWGGTSIALFASPIDSSVPSFPSFPDLLSIFAVGTPKALPNVSLTLEGASVSDIVAKNVRLIAQAVLARRLGRDPHDFEMQLFVQNEFKVVLMNRPFQNVAILEGLNQAGMNLSFTTKLVKGTSQVDFKDWIMDGDTMPTKHYRKGNVVLIGDGNVSAPLMPDVHMIIGNSGGPEFLQLVPMLRNVQGVFLSKDNREKMPLDQIICDMVNASKITDVAAKKQQFSNLFSKKEIAELEKHGFDADSALKIYNETSLMQNSKDYLTTFTAITNLTGSKAVFDIPGIEAVKIDPVSDTVETSSIVAKSTGHQLQINERFLLKTRAMKEKIGQLKANLSQTAVQGSQTYLQGVQSVISTYFDLAKLYVFYGCSDYAERTLSEIDMFCIQQEAALSQVHSLKKTVDVVLITFRDYLALFRKLNSVSSKDLTKQNLSNLRGIKQRVDRLKNFNLAPFLGSWMHADLDAYSIELDAYIKKLKS